MDMMENDRDTFEGLQQDEEIHNLGYSHILLNPISECERDERSATDRFCDEYVMNPFS